MCPSWVGRWHFLGWETKLALVGDCLSHGQRPHAMSSVALWDQNRHLHVLELRCIPESHGVRNMVLNLSPGLSDSKLHAIPTTPVLLQLSVVQETVLCFPASDAYLV